MDNRNLYGFEGCEVKQILTVQKEVNETKCTVYIKGVLDYSTIDIFGREVNDIESNIKIIIINFSELEFIDSTGLGNIINLIHEQQEKGFELILEDINEEIDELFNTVGVYYIMDSLKKAGE